MLFLAKFTIKDELFCKGREELRIIEAISADDAEVKLYLHYDAGLYRFQENGRSINVGGSGMDVMIMDCEISECIK